MAVNEGSGRHDLGTRTQLNACLAGLPVAELVLDAHRLGLEVPDDPITP